MMKSKGALWSPNRRPQNLQPAEVTARKAPVEKASAEQQERLVFVSLGDNIPFLCVRGNQIHKY